MDYIFVVCSTSSITLIDCAGNSCLYFYNPRSPRCISHTSVRGLSPFSSGSCNRLILCYLGTSACARRTSLYLPPHCLRYLHNHVLPGVSLGRIRRFCLEGEMAPSVDREAQRDSQNDNLPSKAFASQSATVRLYLDAFHRVVF